MKYIALLFSLFIATPAVPQTKVVLQWNAEGLPGVWTAPYEPLAEACGAFYSIKVVSLPTYTTAFQHNTCYKVSFVYRPDAVFAANSPLSDFPIVIQ
jgi:hypothetical protein